MLDEVSHKLAGAEFFSMFDATKGFLSLAIIWEKQAFNSDDDAWRCLCFQCFRDGSL